MQRFTEGPNFKLIELTYPSKYTVTDDDPQILAFRLKNENQTARTHDFALNGSSKELLVVYRSNSLNVVRKGSICSENVSPGYTTLLVFR